MWLVCCLPGPKLLRQHCCANNILAEPKDSVLMQEMQQHCLAIVQSDVQCWYILLGRAELKRSPCCFTGHLRQLTTRVTHILPVSDDGGSTAEIVRVLGGPAVGDIRSRCLRLADDTDAEVSTNVLSAASCCSDSAWRHAPIVDGHCLPRLHTIPRAAHA